MTKLERDIVSAASAGKQLVADLQAIVDGNDDDAQRAWLESFRTFALTMDRLRRASPLFSPEDMEHFRRLAQVSLPLVEFVRKLAGEPREGRNDAPPV